MTAQRFSSDAEVIHIGQGMTGCTLPKAEWTHEAHWAAAVWLIRTRPDIQPERDMPGLIRAYNLSCGGQNTDTAGYHETITQASLIGARAVLANLPADVPLHVAVNAVLDSGLGDRDWLDRYWTREVLFSVQARREWVAPDKAPLEL
jgi:hypothetical protein